MHLPPKSIKWQMTLTTSAAFAAAILIFGWMSLTHIEETRRLVVEHQLALAKHVADDLDSRLEAARSAVATFGATAPAAVFADARLAQTWLDNRAGAKTALLDRGIFLLDRAGRVIAASSLLPQLTKNPEFRKSSASLLGKKEAFISPPFLAEGGTRLISLIGLPVRSPDGRVLGGIAGALDMGSETLLGGVSHLRHGETGYFFTATADGDIVTSPDSDQSTRGSIHPVSQELLKQVTLHDLGTMETSTPNGTRALSTLIRLRTTGWILGARLPTREAYAPIRKQQRDVVLFMLLGLLATGSIAWITVRLSAHPIERLIDDILSIDTIGWHHGRVAASGTSSEIVQLADAFNRQLERIEQDRHQMKLSASIFENTHEGILIADANRNILSANRAFTDITGYASADIRGQNLRMLQSGIHDQDFYRELWDSVGANGVWRGEVWARRRDGEIFPEKFNVNAIYGEDREITHYLVILSDISDIKSTQKKLETIATTDVLTGLPNRALLSDRMLQGLAHAQRHDQMLAVAFVDLDGFKEVNERDGLLLGDKLLTKVAERFSAHVRSGDTVARLGGDEFVLLITGTTSLEQVMAALQRCLSAVSLPYEFDGCTVKISASIGVTVYPLDDADPETLIRHADQAMFQAKSEGRGRIHLFDTERDREIQTRHQQLERIRSGLRDSEMLMYYQPKVSLRDGTVVGAEALLRWRHPEHGLLVPPQFLEPFFDHELVIEIGEWAIDQAMRQMSSWLAEHDLRLPVSVNLSARHLVRTGFSERLRAIFARFPDIPPEWLEIEILESDALQDINHVQSVIQECQELGVSFALDDFGTGYSSLSYLKNLAANTLKIDRSFVHGMLESPDDMAIVEGVVRLAEVFKLQVVAEGVETSAHSRALLGMGCHLVQGYGIARPMAAADIPAWARAYPVHSGELTAG